MLNLVWCDYGNPLNLSFFAIERPKDINGAGEWLFHDHEALKNLKEDC